MAQAAQQQAQDSILKSIERLKEEYTKLQIGRASSGLVENVMVDAYGSVQPMKAIASISVPDARTVQIQPWDKALLSLIEKTIGDSDLNLNPTNNGAAVIINIPALTEERRKDLVKVVGRLGEEAKISIRNARHDAMSVFKRMEGDGDLTEDDRNRYEKQLQEKVDKANEEVTSMAKKKEESIMTI